MSAEQTVEIPKTQQPAQPQKKNKKKKSQEKYIIGASDYKDDQIEQKEEPKPKQHPQRQKQTQKKGHQTQQPAHQQQRHQQMNQYRMLEMTYSYHIACLLEENCLSSGSFVRKFMDDDGFIACELLAKIFQFVFYSFFSPRHLFSSFGLIDILMSFAKRKNRYL